MKIITVILAIFFSSAAYAQENTSVHYAAVMLDTESIGQIEDATASIHSDNKLSPVSLPVIWLDTLSSEIFDGEAPSLMGKDNIRSIISMTYGDCRNLLDLLYQCRDKEACILLIASRHRYHVPSSEQKQFSVHSVDLSQEN